MKVMSRILMRLIGWLIGLAAVIAVPVTAFVYGGQEHREAVQGIAREFFVLVEKASRVRRVPASAPASPTPEGGIIQ